jgi:hypothetical protein
MAAARSDAGGVAATQKPSQMMTFSARLNGVDVKICCGVSARQVPRVTPPRYRPRMRHQPVPARSVAARAS